MEIINYILLMIYSYVVPTVSDQKFVKLEGSSLNNVNGGGYVRKGNLNPSKVLTLTIVTGSLSKTKLVADYYRIIEGLTVFDETEMHFKLAGSVDVISKEFKTSFSEYECGDKTSKDACFATNTDISIPQTLQSSIIGVLGLENMLTLTPF